jgi:hypothetical protein
MSIGYINIGIQFLDCIHCPVLYLKHGVSENAFCLRLLFEPTHLVPTDRRSLCPETAVGTT